MYVQVASKQVVTDSADCFSEAVSMEGANAIQVGVTVFANETTTTANELTVSAEGSNDLQNWSSLSGSISFNNGLIGYQTTAITSVAYQYVRLKYTVDESGKMAVMAAGINTSHQ